MLIVFAETPGANYALSQFFHQDDDGDDDHDDHHDDADGDLSLTYIAVPDCPPFI